MKDQQDYINDIAEIRSMMVRSSKFLSLSGLAGILAGTYALAGSWIVHSIFEFQPDEIFYTHSDLSGVVMTAVGVLVFSLVSAVFDSKRKAKEKKDKVWNATSRRMLTNMSIPLFAGGFMIVVLITKGLLGLIAPLTLVFYGLALFNAGFYTIKEVRILGLMQMFLGLLNLAFITYGLLFWVIGFGVVHILYGIYMYFRYER